MTTPVFITRSQPGADAFASRLRALGYDAQALPLLAAEPTYTAAPTAADTISGALVTSAHAIQYLPADFPINIKLYAVGTATASAARTAGFCDVQDGGGDVTALGHAVRATNPQGTWLHIGAEILAPDTKDALAGIGKTLLYWPNYRTVPLTPPETIFRPCVLTVHSARAGKALVDAIRVYGPRAALSEIIVLCLSDAVLESVAAANFGQMYVAETPDEDALTTLLQARMPKADH